MCLEREQDMLMIRPGQGETVENTSACCRNEAAYLYSCPSRRREGALKGSLECSQAAKGHMTKSDHWVRVTTHQLALYQKITAVAKDQQWEQPLLLRQKISKDFLKRSQTMLTITHPFIHPTIYLPPPCLHICRIEQNQQGITLKLSLVRLSYHLSFFRTTRRLMGLLLYASCPWKNHHSVNILGRRSGQKLQAAWVNEDYSNW